VIRYTFSALLTLCAGLVGIAASVLLIPVVAALGAIVLALFLAAAALGVVLSVPGLLVLLTGAILKREAGLVERTLRWWSPPRPTPPTPPMLQPWSEEREIIDAEYRAQIGYQLESLIAYRNEFLALTGFLGVIASTTVALAAVAVTAAFFVGMFTNLLLFARMSIHGKKMLDDYLPNPTDPTRLSESVESRDPLSTADFAPSPSPDALRAIALQQREIAYQSNLNSLEWRDHLLSQVRAIIVVAVAVLSATAVVEALLA
jgi:hypothetical protein